MQHSESIAALATALATAQGEIENATKNATNPHFRSSYADLAEVINTVRPIFSKHGLAVSQCPAYENGIVSVTTVLMHQSGEWLSSICSAPVSKQDAQGVGSCITYARRYSLAAMAGIAQEDDDANSAVGTNTKPAAPPAPPTPQVALATADDLKTLADEFKRIGITSRDQMLSTCSDHVGRKLKSAKDLTRKEAMEVTSKLKEVADAQ